ncbi:MAG: EamA family transporter [Pseudomonadota bacterium]
MSRALLTPKVLIPFTVATLIWGSTWLVIRDQLGVVAPTWSVAYRFASGSAAMFVWAAIRREPLIMAPAGHAFALVFALFQFVLNFNFVYRAEAHITSGLVAVLFSLLLVPNAILGRLLLKTPLTPRFLFGSAIALVGVGLLIVQEMRSDTSSAAETWAGLIMTITGVLSASAANIMQGSHRGRAMPMAAMLAWGMLFGALVNALIGWTTVGPPTVELRPAYILGVLYLGVFASAIAFTCYFAVIRAVGPAVAAYSGVITPVLAMILSTFFENYRWTALAAAGGVVAFAGLLIALSARRPVAKSG